MGSAGHNGFDMYALAVQAKLQEVGKYEVRKGIEIAFELFSFLNIIQPFFRRLLGLNIADDLILTIPQAKIRVATLSRPGKRCDVHVLFPRRQGQFP